MSDNNNHLIVYMLLALIIVVSLVSLSYQYNTNIKIEDSFLDLKIQMQRDHSNLEKKIVNQQIEIVTNNTD